MFSPHRLTAMEYDHYDATLCEAIREATGIDCRGDSRRIRYYDYIFVPRRLNHIINGTLHNAYLRDNRLLFRTNSADYFEYRRSSADGSWELADFVIPVFEGSMRGGKIGFKRARFAWWPFRRSA